MTVNGICDSRFARVREAFAENLASGLELGGGVSLMADGKLVVDLWGGHTDAARSKPWRRNTLVNVWSATKGIVALAVAMLVERGKLDYAVPVARWWPEFAAGGKEHISLNLVLSHQAGLNGLSVPMPESGLLAWTPYAEALASMSPLWEPGSRCIYHAFTYGHLIGEPLRRIDGRSPGRFIAEEIAGPLGIDFFVGLPEREEPRVAQTIAAANASDWIAAVQQSPFPHSCINPVPRALAPNDLAWRAAEVPGANGQSNAAALATIYGALASGGGGIVGKDAIKEAARPRVRGWDDSLSAPAAFAAGYQIEDLLGIGRAAAFGHAGWGGALGFADPEAGIGFGYVTNLMLGSGNAPDPRLKALTDAVYESV